MKMTQNDPKFKTLRRREVVKKCMCQGLTVKQTLEVLRKRKIKAAEKTVDRDISAVKAEVRKEIEMGGLNIHEILSDFLMKYDEAYAQAWSAHRGAVSSKEKVFALRIIKDLLGDRIKILQSLGLIVQAPLKVEGTVTTKQILEVIKTTRLQIEKEREEND